MSATVTNITVTIQPDVLTQTYCWQCSFLQCYYYKRDLNFMYKNPPPPHGEYLFYSL